MAASNHPGVGAEPSLPSWLLEAPLFHDRFEAGRALASELSRRLAGKCVVVGLARGGAQVAAEVAGRIGAPLDIVAVRKVRHPWQPEFALGAVTPGDGVYVRNRGGLSAEQLAVVVARAQDEAETLDRVLHASHPAVALAGKRAVLVDDGLATGATMLAAVRSARGSGASEVVAAVPVAAPESAALVAAEATVVCLHEAADFVAVSLWYEDFPQVDDDEVIRLLDEASSEVTGRGEG